VSRPAPDDILDVARTQVLEQGIGLTEHQALDALRLPDDRVDELLDLAHNVRMKWCGDEVEVEVIVSLKTGGCPEDCHFCSQSGLFDSPVRAAWLDVPSLVKARRRRLPPARPSSASWPPSVARTSG
jgi:biotin synthase